jgi:protein N-terminal amidase
LTRLTIHSPYKFEAPWSAWEFAYHILHKQASLVILSMAWLTRDDPRSYSRSPKDPDMETLSYWLARIEPLIRAETEGEIIVVFANRTGTEEEAVYAGTSAVLGIQAGEVKVYGILGRGEKELLVVDTNKRPQAKLISEPNSTASEARQETASDKSDPSMNTAATANRPSEPNRHPQTMEDVVTPLSPVDPISPHSYFASNGREAEVQTLRENLKSSIGQTEVRDIPNSPTLVRPKSPKSRNASRTRWLEQQKIPLMSHDLANDEQVSQKAIGVRSHPHSAAAAPDRYTLPRPKSAAW